MNPHVKQFQSYGMKLVPLHDETKKPKTKPVQNVKGEIDYKWKGVEWTDDDLANANTIGVMHRESNIIDVDFDSNEAQKFIHLLPDTLTIGKKVNGRPVATHKLYSYDGACKTESFGKTSPEGCQVELLTNTQTRIIGDRIILNDVQPKKLTFTEYNELKNTLKKIYALAILTKYYPKEGIGRRDEFVFRVAGTLALECKHWELHEKEDFVEQLITVNGDTKEFQNRIKKVAAQEEAAKNGKEVAGVKALSQFIGVKQLDCIDKLRKEQIKGITVLKFSEFLNRSYPPVRYVIYPLIATETIIQVWSMPGIGKTWFGLQLAACIASGKQFLRWQPSKDINEEIVKYPILYVEGEMRASSLRDRIVEIQQSLDGFNYENLNIAPVAEQPNETFEPLNEERGRENVEIRLKELYEQTGKKPFLFLDNISCLTSIQEKDGVEWISFMSWLIKLRARGYTVVFFHHSTKEGSTSSGSNMKERSVDIEIKLERPDKEEFIEGYDGAQFKVSFPKWREFANSDYAKPFIATLDRNSHEWKYHEIMKKTKRQVKSALENSNNDIKAAMSATGLSQAQVYRYMKEIRSETKSINNGFQYRKAGKLSTRLKKENKEIAEKKVIDLIKQETGKEISMSQTIEGTKYEAKNN